MKRTRKWAYVAQEAARLADLGLSPPEIAHRLGATRVTVKRWMQAGKVTDTRRGAKGQQRVPGGRSSEEWGKAVRSSYALDQTDEELVQMAETMLVTAHDTSQSITIRMAAMREFRATVKQLALVARSADEKPAEEPQAPPPAEERMVRREGADPRRLLMAVK